MKRIRNLVCVDVEELLVELEGEEVARRRVRGGGGSICGLKMDFLF